MSKLFKIKREKLGRSLQEVASSTRIKEICLVAIEEEDYDKLPIEVYARGYIKEYAKYLNLPVGEGFSPYEAYLEMKKGPKQSVTPTPDPSGGILQKSMEQIQKKKTDESVCQEVKNQPAPPLSVQTAEAAKKYGSRFLWKGVLLLIVISAIVYQFVSWRNAEQESRVVPMTQQVPPPQDGSTNAVTPPQDGSTNTVKPPHDGSTNTVTPPQASSVPEPGEIKSPVIMPATEETKPPVTASVKTRHKLVISAKELSWVQVIVDGAKTREALMKPGESLTFEADKTMSVVIGNAGGVSMKFDGKELPAGKHAEVLRFALPGKPKVEKQSQDVLPPATQKPSPSVKKENATPHKSSNEEASPNKLPEQPTSTNKP
jgi:cytoskeleton protein RodZ